MLILGIETTCDETGAAVVKDGNPSTHSGNSVQAGSGLKILSNVVASSVELQKKYGGVVPEVAAREQIRMINPVIREALLRAFEVRNEKWENPHFHLSHLTSNIDAIAVSHGPGLIGSLLIGVETAKTLALAWNKPLIPVNHLVGHIYANWIGKNFEKYPQFPLIALVVSGGHTDLVLMKDHGRFKLIGTTLDDSAGEAFDKVARLLGLGYPGGPEIEKLASSVQGSAFRVKLPRPMIGSNDFDFSFSGLKTAVVYLIQRNYSSSEFDVISDESRSYLKRRSSRQARTINDDLKVQIADEFQKAVVDVLVKKTIRAAENFGCESIVLGGGVAANTLLCSQMTDRATRLGIKVYFPSKNLSIDNGAMIAAAAFHQPKKIDPLKLQANPGLHFT